MSSDESFSEEEWEEVEPIGPEGSPGTEFTEEQLIALAKSSQSSLSAKAFASAQGIEITFGKDTIGKRKNKEKGEFEKAFEAFQKQLLHGTHKAHLLCLLSHGIHQSRLCDDPTLQALLLSLIVNEADLYRDDLDWYKEETLLKLVKWFSCNRKTIEEQITESLIELGQVVIERGVPTVLLLVTLLRVLKLRARLVMVLDPLPYKPMSVKKSVSPSEVKTPVRTSVTKKNLKKVTKVAQTGGNARTSKKGKEKAGNTSSKKSAKKSKPGSTSDSTTECDTSPYFKKSLRNSSQCKRKRLDSPSYSDQTPPMSDDEDSEEDFQPPRKKHRPSVSKPKMLNKPDSEVPSNHQDPSEVKSEDPRDTTSWVEVYVTSKKKWVCVHLPSCSVGQPHLCERDCSIPLSYVIAFETGADLAGMIVRDVTPRYASDWCTRVYKQRLDRDWWMETLRPFEPLSVDEQREEDEDIIELLHAQPIPSLVSDYKSHPLYALERHLLKFEAIYPENSKVLGFCRGEPVYSRGSVHTLHTRETWLKEGRMIRVGEPAFKSVKARPKKGQPALENQRSTVEVYGKWQTEDYIPQPIVDGKVPRNEYGNVELFQPSMLPPGGAHVKIQGIQRVARKLGIDYAPAMMGWDFHGGFCHPIIEGIVVAKENEGVILEAWEQEEQIRIDKAVKKRERRVVERWRKFTKALLIKERLKRKYDYTD